MGDREKLINEKLGSHLVKYYLGQGHTKPEGHVFKALDVGSKFPWLSHKIAQNHGWETYACDGIPEILEFKELHKLQVNAFQIDFEKAAKEGYPWGNIAFDVLTMVHVIEHIYYPLDALREMHKLLSDDGMMFVRCPNSDIRGIDHEIKTPSYWDIHVQIWNDKSIFEAFKRTGFKVINSYPLEGAGQADYYVVKERISVPLCPSDASGIEGYKL
jgi:2-polyprenyl-3-methyl-5-hydroxy-6-metoxy-1,4-benzoquinol methylase